MKRIANLFISTMIIVLVFNFTAFAGDSSSCCERKKSHYLVEKALSISLQVPLFVMMGALIYFDAQEGHVSNVDADVNDTFEETKRTLFSNHTFYSNAIEKLRAADNKLDDLLSSFDDLSLNEINNNKEEIIEQCSRIEAYIYESLADNAESMNALFDVAERIGGFSNEISFDYNETLRNISNGMINFLDPVEENIHGLFMIAVNKIAGFGSAACIGVANEGEDVFDSCKNQMIELYEMSLGAFIDYFCLTSPSLC